MWEPTETPESFRNATGSQKMVSLGLSRLPPTVGMDAMVFGQQCRVLTPWSALDTLGAVLMTPPWGAGR